MSELDMSLESWFKANMEKLDRVENNDDKAYDLFVEVCTSLVEERDKFKGTEEFRDIVFRCQRVLVSKLDIERDYVTFVRNYFHNIDILDYSLFKAGLAVPSMVTALELYLIYYKEYKDTLFNLGSIASFLHLDDELSSRYNKHYKDAWDDVLRSLFNSDLDKAYELLFPKEANKESFWAVRNNCIR